jgi:hypothetical protein
VSYLPDDLEAYSDPISPDVAAAVERAIRLMLETLRESVQKLVDHCRELGESGQ